MPQWALYERDFRAIDKVLYDLLERTNALSILLVDRSGQLITTVGRASDFDSAAFASLAAADLTANVELANLLGESGIEAVVNEGRNRCVYSRLMAERVILCTIFDRRSTLGLVRLRANRAAQVLDGVFRSLFDKVGLTEPVRDAGEFAAAAGREVDALFGD